MRYAKLEILSDTPLRKFLCIRLEANPVNATASRVIQICNVSVDAQLNAPNGIITVVVKGAQLPYSVIQRIVRDYLTGTLQLHQDYRFQITDLEG